MNTLLNIDKNLHHENDKKNNSDLRHQLQLDYASENTFLSLLRTAGVLTGIAAILIRLKKQLVFVRYFIIGLLISLIITSFNYYRYILKKNTFESDIAFTIGINSIFFAILLCIILIIMIFITFKKI